MSIHKKCLDNAMKTVCAPLNLSDDEDAFDMTMIPQNLVSVDLSGCTNFKESALHALAWIDTLERLTLRGLDSLSAAAIKSIAGSCRELAYLDFSESGLDQAALPHVAKLPNLNTLYLARCRSLDNLGYLSQLAHISEFDVSEGPLPATFLSQLSKKMSIKQATLQRCPQLTDASVIALLEENCGTLETLDLAQVSKITDDIGPSLQRCTNLLYLDLSGSKITGKSLRCLKTLTGLTTLKLNGCKELYGNVVDISRQHPHLIEFSASDCPLQGLPPKFSTLHRSATPETAIGTLPTPAPVSPLLR